ncbi:MAG: hypothetical protein OHK0029_31780 [Armatimonadaceae bacterium]
MNMKFAPHLRIAAIVSAVLVGIACVVQTNRCGEIPPAPELIATEAVVEAPLCETVEECENGIPAEDIALAAMTEDEELEVEREEAEKIRRAALDFVRENFPGSKTDGVFLLPLRPANFFIAGVDTRLADGDRRTIDLIVRRYSKRVGGDYWRAEALDGGQAHLLQQMSPL